MWAAYWLSLISLSTKPDLSPPYSPLHYQACTVDKRICNKALLKRLSGNSLYILYNNHCLILWLKIIKKKVVQSCLAYKRYGQINGRKAKHYYPVKKKKKLKGTSMGSIKKNCYLVVLSAIPVIVPTASECICSHVMRTLLIASQEQQLNSLSTNTGLIWRAQRSMFHQSYYSH